MAGNDALPLSDEAVINDTAADTTPPALQSATADGATVVFTFDEALKVTAVLPGAFVLDGDMGSFNPSEVVIAGDKVTLTMPNPAVPGNNVSYGYTDPGDTTALMDLAENRVANLSGFASNITEDFAPALTEATIDGATLTLTYDEDIEPSSIPAVSDFAVTVAGNAVGVSSVAVAGAAVALTLATPASAGDTVTLSYVAGDSPIQDVTGNPAADLTGRAMTNDTEDTTPPNLTGATIDDTTLTLTYNENLDSASIPAVGDFAVTVAGTTASVNSVAVAGAAVTLTLATPASPGDTVTVSYLMGGSAIQDLAANPAADLTDQAVTNSTADTAHPVLTGATIDAATLTLTYNESLDEGSIPVADDFDVTVGGNSVTVSSVAVAGTTVTLTLAAEANPGDEVTLVYTIGASPIQDLAGNDAAALTGQAVTNNTVAPLTIASANVMGTMMTISWSEHLATGPLPAPGDFKVMAAGTELAVTDVTADDAMNPQMMKLVLAASPRNSVTVMLSYTRGTNPIQGISGAIAPDFVDSNVTNYTADSFPPQLLSLEVNGTALAVRFDEYLNSGSGTLPGAFTVAYGPEATIVAVTAISHSGWSAGGLVGTKLTLTLASPVPADEPTVTLSYLAANDATKLTDQASPANALASFTDEAVTNVAPPSFVGATMNADTLTLTYNKELDESSVPPPADFSVQVASKQVKANDVSVSANTVTLTLGALTAQDNVGTVAYTNNSGALRDLSGTPLASMPPQPVTNATVGSDTTAPTLLSASVNRNLLKLTYSESMYGAPQEAAAAFWAYLAGSAPPANLKGESLTVSGATVTIALNIPAAAGQTYQLFYNSNGFPLEDLAGNDTAHISYGGISNITDPTGPALQSANVSLATLTITYDDALDPASVPDPADFTVNAGDTTLAVSTVAVTGNTVTLTLAAPAADGATVTVSYTPGTKPLQNVAGTAAPAVTGAAVANGTDTTAPALTGALVNGSTILLTYDDAPVTNSVPVAADYMVIAGGTPVTVSNVALSGANLTLTLPTPVTQGAAVAVAYLPGATPLKDAAGNESDALTGRAVTNLTPADGVLHVGPSQPFTTIEAAVLVAAAGNTIAVHDGTYTPAQTLNITQENLTIRSANGAATTIIALAASTGIAVNAGNVTISGLHLTAAEGANVNAMILIWDTASAATVQGNVIDGAARTQNAVGVYSGFEGALTISGNTISQSSYGINVGELSGATVTIANNQVTDSSTRGISVSTVGGSGFYWTDPRTNVLKITGNTVGDPTLMNQSGTGIYVGYIDWDAHVEIADNKLPFNSEGVVLGRIGEWASETYDAPDYAGPVVAVDGNTITRSGVGIEQGLFWHQGSQVTISDNKVLDSDYDGFYSEDGGAGSVRIVRNEFSGTQDGSGLNFDGAWFDPTAAWTIGHNTITRNAEHGIYLDFWSDEPVSVSVVDNFISGNGTSGIYLGEGALGVTVVRNEFSDNMEAALALTDGATTAQLAYNQFVGGGVAVDNQSGPIDATLNWWGAATGPGASPGSQLTGDVTVSPWLTAVAWTPASLTLNRGETASAQAVFTTLTRDGATGTVPLDFGLWAPRSSDAAVATVTAEGAVTGAATGTATISTGLGFDPGLKVTVQPDPTPAPFVTISATALETREATVTVTGTANPGAAVSVGDSTATASAEGNWTAEIALAEGVNTLTATNAAASASVTVTRDSTPPVVTLTAAATETTAETTTLTATTEAGATLTIAGQNVSTGSVTVALKSAATPSPPSPGISWGTRVPPP